MIRTQIYLPEAIHKKLTLLRTKYKRSVAQIVREALERHLREESIDQENDILKLAEIGISGGPKDLSARVDDYLYGTQDESSS